MINMIKIKLGKKIVEKGKTVLTANKRSYTILMRTVIIFC